MERYGLTIEPSHYQFKFQSTDLKPAFLKIFHNKLGFDIGEFFKDKTGNELDYYLCYADDEGYPDLSVNFFNLDELEDLDYDLLTAAIEKHFAPADESYWLAKELLQEILQCETEHSYCFGDRGNEDFTVLVMVNATEYHKKHTGFPAQIIEKESVQYV
ncbi:hypothetical protein [Niallia taxi]|uniref:hypothetical protein n=1 Tax=Niallia taxi TaxID=2499688 RepID=UPI0015F75639|nr:hypothetical protein [Niallia taxi]